ncbi:hypothetical protein HORIV_03260 [Vreelandella olivaria]|uniref:Haem-binding uptake Tiki superfamily ChaN domain-containing protein n=1 Tax=Vreelandella olivaria TaxID=390919 RepID=A0ABM7GBZ6_9GAMM|nr:hypothetical protein HORIV_03260 [Halomonas olivaria]
MAGLHALRDDMVIGLEMLPRSAQPALDAWIAGELDDNALLEQTQWEEAWGFDAALYMPILAFARMAQIPLIALNIDPGLRQRWSMKAGRACPRMSAMQSHHHSLPAPAIAPGSPRCLTSMLWAMP